jgi:hypothetical protein
MEWSVWWAGVGRQGLGLRRTVLLVSMTALPATSAP